MLTLMCRREPAVVSANDPTATLAVQCGMDLMPVCDQGPRSAAQSATNHRLELRGIAVALDLDRSSCAFDLGKIGSGQLDGRCADILLQAIVLRSAWNRDYPRALRQQPGERELSRGGPLFARDPLQQVDQRLVLLHRFGCKAGQKLSIVSLRNLGFR